MAHTDGVGDSVSLPNYAGALFTIGNQFTKTPLLTMSGGLTGGRRVATDTFPMGNFLTLDAASNDFTVSETSSLTAPASDVYAPEQKTNFVQIVQRRFTLSYKKQSVSGQISGEAVVDMGVTNMGNPQTQRSTFLAQLAVDFNYAMWYGASTDPAAAATNGKMSGIITAIAADGDTEVDGGSNALTKAKVEELEVAFLAKNTGMQIPVLMGGSFQLQRLNDLYGFAPESVTVGGVTLRGINLPTLGLVGVVYDPGLATDDLALVDMAKIAPIFMIVPGKPAVFFEPLAKTGAGTDEQLYTQISVDYTHPDVHAYIKDLATS